MKKQRKSAFTIVELVIVIAVIAILAVVLVPTFGSIIKSANVSSDQKLAASLTKELHVWLKGETIDDEGELMVALTKSGIINKLVPKSADKGYHFWFNMDTKNIILMTSEDYMSGNIVDVPEGSEGEETHLPSGPALMSATLINRTERETANISFRDILGIGVYLIDQGGNALADALNFIDEHVNDHNADASKVHSKIVAKFASLSDDRHAKDFANAVTEQLDKTTIAGETGHHSTKNESENVYISATAESLGTEYYNDGQRVDKAPGLDKPVEIPSNITSAPDGSFVYGNKDEEPTKVIISSSQQNIFDAGAFGKTEVVNGKVEGEVTHVEVDGEEYIPGSDGHLGQIQETDGKEAVVTIIELKFKLPWLNFEASFAVPQNGKGDVISSNGKIYVAQRLGGLRLQAVNVENITQVSHNVDNWEVLPGEYGSVEIDPVTGVLDLTTAVYVTVGGKDVCEVQVKSTARNKNGAPVENTTTVVIVKAVSATVTIGKQTVSTTGTDKDITLRFNGQHTSYAVVANATYSGDSAGKAPLQPAAKLEATDLDGLRYEGNKLTFQTNDDGTLVEGFNFWFTAVVDGIITKFVDVTVVDETQAAVKLNYNKLGHADAPDYYIGTNPDGTNTTLKLSELFKISNSEKFGSKVKVTIYAYAENSGYLSPRSELNKVAKANPNQYTLTATYDNEVTTAEWATSTITFKGNIKTAKSVFIEIAPENEVSTVVEVQIVNNAINVTKDTPVTTFAKDLSNSVVLHSNVTLTTGQKVNLAASYGFYGNGWVISATGWKSNAASNALTDALISVNGGTVDNVYIDGPHYPVLNYDHNNNGYYASGISFTGTSTLQNSYVSGFRQPVCSSGSASTLTVKNTTLRGGNYANLLLKDGDLNLHDVTTIQDQGGIKTTVDDTSKHVTGVGIGLERAALDSTITITGYLDQYNWIKKGQSATMPTLSVGDVSLNVNNLFGFIFNGVDTKILGMKVTADMGSLKYFINQDSSMNATSRNEGYVHAGIVFGELGSDAPNWTETVTIDESGRTDGTIKMRKFEKLEMLFSKTGLERNGSYLFTAKDYFGTDGYVVIWSHKDNRQWAAQSMDYNIGWSGITVKRLVVPSGGAVDSTKPIIKINTTDYPIEYQGYYKTGVYSSTFNK